jgi:hypothetical protein
MSVTVTDDFKICITTAEHEEIMKVISRVMSEYAFLL